MSLQTGVFNVTDPAWGLSTANLGSVNRSLLQTMVDTLLDAGSGPTGGNGGTIEFPSVGTFEFTGSAIVIGKDLSSITQPFAIIIQGDGQGSESKPLIQKTDGGDLFQVNNTAGGDDHVGGITFRDLQIAYSTVQSSGAAIHVVNGENVRVFRCVFQDCPRAVHFENSLQGCMIDCTAIYPVIGGAPVSGTAVSIGGTTGDNSAKETFIAGCTFLENNSPTGSVGIQINNVEHVRIINTRVEAFNQGIVVSPSGTDHDSRKLYFGNVAVFSGAPTGGAAVGQAVLIQPENGTWVGEVTFDCCELDASDGGTPYRGGGVVIDPVNGAGGGGVIDQIRFIGCHVCRWNGPGLQVIGVGSGGTANPTNIEVTGGFYSLNGANPASGLPSAGIAISGSPFGIRITGATCNNMLYSGGAFLTPTQDYGISIGSGAQNVFVRSCDFNGNLTGAVESVSPVTNVQLAECAAYNDQGTPVRTTSPAALTPFGGATFGYYGPVEFYVSGGNVSQIAIDGNNTNLTSGSFFLMPGETAELTYSVVPTFLMIGK